MSSNLYASLSFSSCATKQALPRLQAPHGSPGFAFEKLAASCQTFVRLNIAFLIPCLDDCGASFSIGTAAFCSPWNIQEHSCDSPSNTAHTLCFPCHLSCASPCGPY